MYKPTLFMAEQGQSWLMPVKDHRVSVMSPGCCSSCWTGWDGAPGLIAGMGTLLDRHISSRDGKALDVR